MRRFLPTAFGAAVVRPRRQAARPQTDDVGDRHAVGERLRGFERLPRAFPDGFLHGLAHGVHGITCEPSRDRAADDLDELLLALLDGLRADVRGVVAQRFQQRFFERRRARQQAAAVAAQSLAQHGLHAFGNGKGLRYGRQIPGRLRDHRPRHAPQRDVLDGRDQRTEQQRAVPRLFRRQGRFAVLFQRNQRLVHICHGHLDEVHPRRQLLRQRVRPGRPGDGPRQAAGHGAESRSADQRAEEQLGVLPDALRERLFEEIERTRRRFRGRSRGAEVAHFRESFRLFVDLGEQLRGGLARQGRGRAHIRRSFAGGEHGVRLVRGQLVSRRREQGPPAQIGEVAHEVLRLLPRPESFGDGVDFLKAILLRQRLAHVLIEIPLRGEPESLGFRQAPRDALFVHAEQRGQLFEPAFAPTARGLRLVLRRLPVLGEQIVLRHRRRVVEVAHAHGAVNVAVLDPPRPSGVDALGIAGEFLDEGVSRRGGFRCRRQVVLRIFFVFGAVRIPGHSHAAIQPNGHRAASFDYLFSVSMTSIKLFLGSLPGR